MTIDKKTRRALRQKLGSRTARRAGTKSKAKKAKPRTQLAALIREHEAKKESGNE